MSTPAFMGRHSQDGDWPPKPPKSNPIDDLRWEVVNKPDGHFAKLVHISNMLLFLSVGLGLSIVVLAIAVRIAISVLMGAFE